jgi:hypothetical protein
MVTMMALTKASLYWPRATRAIPIAKKVVEEG